MRASDFQPADKSGVSSAFPAECSVVDGKKEPAKNKSGKTLVWALSIDRKTPDGSACPEGPMTLRSVLKAFALMCGITVVLTIAQAGWVVHSGILDDVFFPLQMFGWGYNSVPLGVGMLYFMLIGAFGLIVLPMAMPLLTLFPTPTPFAIGSAFLLIDVGTTLGDRLGASILYEQAAQNDANAAQITHYFPQAREWTTLDNIAKFTFLSKGFGFWNIAIAVAAAAAAIAFLFLWRGKAPSMIGTEDILILGVSLGALGRMKILPEWLGIVILVLLAAAFLLIYFPNEAVNVRKLLAQNCAGRWSWALAFCLWVDMNVVFIATLCTLSGTIPFTMAAM